MENSTRGGPATSPLRSHTTPPQEGGSFDCAIARVRRICPSAPMDERFFHALIWSSDQTCTIHEPHIPPTCPCLGGAKSHGAIRHATRARFSAHTRTSEHASAKIRRITDTKKRDRQTACPAKIMPSSRHEHQCGMLMLNDALRCIRHPNMSDALRLSDDGDQFLSRSFWIGRVTDATNH